MMDGTIQARGSPAGPGVAARSKEGGSKHLDEMEINKSHSFSSFLGICANHDFNTMSYRYVLRNYQVSYFSNIIDIWP